MRREKYTTCIDHVDLVAVGGKKCAKQGESTHIFTVLRSSARISRNIENHQVINGCHVTIAFLIHPNLGACD